MVNILAALSILNSSCASKGATKKVAALGSSSGTSHRSGNYIYMINMNVIYICNEDLLFKLFCRIIDPTTLFRVL